MFENIIIIVVNFIGQRNKTYQTARVQTGLEVPWEALYLFLQIN
jgi:hypothetical protein